MHDRGISAAATACPERCSSSNGRWKGRRNSRSAKCAWIVIATQPVDANTSCHVSFRPRTGGIISIVEEGNIVRERRIQLGLSHTMLKERRTQERSLQSTAWMNCCRGRRRQQMLSIAERCASFRCLPSRREPKSSVQLYDLKATEHSIARLPHIASIVSERFGHGRLSPQV